MTPPQNKKNYTNADIIKRLDNMNSRIEALEVYKLSQEAGRAAVDEYKRQEANDRKDNAQSDIVGNVKSLMPYIIAFLVAAAAFLYIKSASGK